MNGLLQAEQPAAQPQAQTAGNNQQQGQQQGQQIYQKIVEMALGFAYSEQGTQMIREGLELERAPIIQNIGNTVAKILMRILISVKTAGKSIPPKMLFQAGMEITSAVVEMAEALGLTDNAPGIAKQAFFASLTIAGKELPDEMLSKEERAEFRNLIQQVQQMKGQQQPQQPEQAQQPSGGA